MLYYVNEHLFDPEVQSEDNTWNGGEHYTREAIKTSSMLVKKDKETGETTSVSRILAMWNHGDPNGNTMVSSTIGGPNKTVRVNVRTSKSVKFDSDVFCIAIPFAGFAVPMDGNEDLAVFRSTIGKSDEYFDHIDGERYRKALYAVVRPDYHAFDRDAKEYDSSADFVAKFAISNRTRKDQNPANLKWKIRTVRVHFKELGDYEITEEIEEVPYDAFDPETTKDTPLFPTVEPYDPETADKDKGNKRPYKK